jgi:hypothetical protein
MQVYVWIRTNFDSFHHVIGIVGAFLSIPLNSICKAYDVHFFGCFVSFKHMPAFSWDYFMLFLHIFLATVAITKDSA